MLEFVKNDNGENNGAIDRGDCVIPCRKSMTVSLFLSRVKLFKFT